MFCFIRAFIGSVHDVCCIYVCVCVFVSARELSSCAVCQYYWSGRFDTFLVNNHSNNSDVADVFRCRFLCVCSFVILHLLSYGPFWWLSHVVIVVGCLLEIFHSLSLCLSHVHSLALCKSLLLCMLFSSN